MLNSPELKDFTFPDISVTRSHLLKSFKNALLQYYYEKAFPLFQITEIKTRLGDRSLKQLFNIFNPYDQDLCSFPHQYPLRQKLKASHSGVTSLTPRQKSAFT